MSLFYNKYLFIMLKKWKERLQKRVKEGAGNQMNVFTIIMRSDTYLFSSYKSSYMTIYNLRKIFTLFIY